MFFQFEEKKVNFSKFFYFLQTGEQKVQYNAGVGIVCMYLYERLLFAGCYDGNIYIFDVKVKFSKNLLNFVFHLKKRN